MLNGFQTHDRDWRQQYHSFQTLWDDPPEFSLVVAEDAGKKFVLGGKACAHVMMLRFKKENTLHEHHYFFGITGNPKPTVSRDSIAQSWLTLHHLKAINPDIKTIYVFHDGGTNEYNNSSGLFLYATFQRYIYLNYFFPFL